MLETEYDIATYDSPSKALEAIRESPIDLVVSDYLMPGMNGIEFFCWRSRSSTPTRHVFS